MAFRSPSFLAAAAALATASLVAGGAPAQAGPPSARTITPRGVGGVIIGATYRSLSRRRLVGPIRQGCVAAGPRARSAVLRGSLRGSVDFTQTSPRKVDNISVTAGGAARGVGIGAVLADVKRAYPRAQVDHRTENMFGITLVNVPAGAGGKLQFALDVKTHQVGIIGIPVIPICE